MILAALDDTETMAVPVVTVALGSEAIAVLVVTVALGSETIAVPVVTVALGSETIAVLVVTVALGSETIAAQAVKKTDHPNMGTALDLRDNQVTVTVPLLEIARAASQIKPVAVLGATPSPRSRKGPLPSLESMLLLLPPNQVGSSKCRLRKRVLRVLR
jgi:hypothetical protein